MPCATSTTAQSDEAVEALLAVCRQNAPVFQRYFGLKAKWLGVEKLRRYDIYAPLAKSDRSIDYADAVNLVLDTFRGFSPVVADHATRSSMKTISTPRSAKATSAAAPSAPPSRPA